MKPTLLELTQDILSSMDSDEVNSISDTVESAQVATIIKTTYRDIISRANLPEQYILFGLDSSDDITKPVLMTLPSDIGVILWVKYDRQTTEDTALAFHRVEPLDIADFMSLTLGQSTNDTVIGRFTQTITTNSSNAHTMTFIYRNDKPPDWYTTFDDGTVIFDSYDSVVDDTLQTSKTMCYGQKVVPWTHEDAFIPDLDDKQFSLLFNEAKSLCFAELKQVAHAKADRSAQRQWVNLQSSKTKIPTITALDKLPNYGRMVRR